ncbi:MAG: hypothetical protein MJ169_08990 [Treponema sp.]|nr:hypothetical protein [Treponema sp.]
MYEDLAKQLLSSVLPQVQPPALPQPAKEIIRVNGIEEARNFSLKAGDEAVLFDNNEDVFYIKKADEVGRNILHAFSYEEIELTEINSNGVSKKDFENFKTEIRGMIKEMNGNGKRNKQTFRDTEETTADAAE